MLQASDIRELLRLIGKENFESIISHHRGERDDDVKMEIERDVAEKLLRNLDKLQPIMREADLLYNERDSLSFYMNRMPPQAADYFIILPNSGKNGLINPYGQSPHVSFSSNPLKYTNHSDSIGFLLDKRAHSRLVHRRGRHTTRIDNELRNANFRELTDRYGDDESYSNVKIFLQDEKEVRRIEYLPRRKENCYMLIGYLFDVSHLIIPITVDDFNFFDFNY